MSPPYRALTLAIHPNTRGFGWMAFSDPLAPYDWGNVGARGKDKNARCLREIEKMLDRLTPETIVLEAFESGSPTRRKRITALCWAIVELAAVRNINVAIYTFKEVCNLFVRVGAQTRDDIAEAVARNVSQIRHLLPPRRKKWQSIRWRLSLFSAAALALTHYQRDALVLLSDLQRER